MIIEKVANALAALSGMKTYRKKELHIEYNRWDQVNRYYLNVDTCIDVGVGRGTEEMYEKVNFDSLILVEPLGIYNKRIKKIVRNRDALWEKVAASDQSGYKHITVNVDKPEKSSFLERKKRYKREGKKKKKRVKTKRIDDIATKENSKTYGIKIDTEGFDMKALRGAEGIMESTKFFVLEVPIVSRFEKSYGIEEVTKFMNEKNFYIGNIVGLDTDSPVKFIDFIFYNSKI